MKHCPKCDQTFPRADFGTQGYCRVCWRKYNQERRRIRQERVRQEQAHPIARHERMEAEIEELRKILDQKERELVALGKSILASQEQALQDVGGR